MSRITAYVRIVALVSVLTGAAASQAILAAPSNDTCTGAVVIPGGGAFPYVTALTADVTDATTTGDPPAPSCQPDVSRSVWYAFTPATTASYTISTCADAPTGTTLDDTVLALYTSSGGCGGSLTEFSGACDDDSCGSEDLQSVVTAVLDAGVTYYVVVWEFGATPPTSGDTAVQLRITQRLLSPPANDRCTGAEPIPGNGLPYLTAVTADITDASTNGDPPAPSCQSDVSRSVWYTFVPASSGDYAFSSCADAPTSTTVDDTVISVYTSTGGCNGPFTQVAGACDNDTCACEELQATVSTSLQAGTTYYVVVWQRGTTPPAAGNTAVQLRVSPLLPPVNDSCQQATTLPLNRPLPGTTARAVDDVELSGSSCFTGVGQLASTAAGRDVSYAFTASAAGEYSFRATGYTISLNLVLYVSADCPTGGPPATVASCLAASNRSTSGPAEEVMCLPLSAGQTVFVFVDEAAMTSGSSFTIEANRCRRETEPNDSPATANLMSSCGIEGTINPAGEADFFALGSLPAGSRVFAIADGVASNSNDFDLRVTTTTDTLEYDDQNNDAPFGSLAPNVGGTPLTGVASYLRVNHFSSIRTAEPYRLYAAVEPPPASATPETEPNDTMAQANSAANNYFSGSRSGVSDVDVFAFDAAAGDLVLIGLDGDPLRDNTPINGGLAVLSACGSALVAVNDIGSTSSITPGTGSLTVKTPNSPGEALTFRAAAAGTYYAKVTGSTIGDYLLSIAFLQFAGDGCSGGACDDPLSCNDGNPCTDDSCEPGTGCVHTNNTAACTDGNACTQTDTCQTGVCVGSNPVVCTASDQCHVAGVCNMGTGFCSNPNAANGTGCSDGNACTQTDTCQTGVCTGSNPVVCTASDQCHVAGVCNTGTGVCSNPAAANGTACSDGNVCTQTDTCQTGVCTGSNPVVCTASDQCHVAGVCNTGTGVCTTPNAANGTGCSDGNACSQTDTCQTGVCTGSNPVVCTASDQCHVAGVCNTGTGFCSNPNAANGTGCSDGNACTQTDTCQTGVCTGSNPVVCTASDQCHVAGVCNMGTGFCSNPNAANGTGCSDGNACTQTDTCQTGVCTGSNPVVCTASDQCHVAGVCNTGTGVCTTPNAANGTACSDGNACMQTDTCQSGVCAGSNPVTCTASDQCHVAGTCDSATGMCSNPNAANGISCSDGNACTQTDTCQAGVCAGSNAVTCTASDQCHVVGTCEFATGMCSNPAAANGTSCSDGSPCTQTDTCQSGVCAGSNPVTCTASDQCHVAGTCDSATGMCSNPNAANGISCSDGNACTQTDTCQAGVCAGSNAVTCTASDQCHVVGTCEFATGMCSNPAAANGTSCSDGSPCTQTDTCQSGVCAGSNPVTCIASDQCHVAGTCDPATGMCSSPSAPDGTTCSDGDSCTTGDTCSGATCAGLLPSPPSGTANFSVDRQSLSWSIVQGATGYDVVQGNLRDLRDSLGDFTTSVDACVVDDHQQTSFSYTLEPAGGQGFFFVARGVNCGGHGSYDSGSVSQAGSRDAEIAAAPASCP